MSSSLISGIDGVNGFNISRDIVKFSGINFSSLWDKPVYT